MERVDLGAQRVSLEPWIANLERCFDGLGFEFPLLNSQLEFVDLVLLSAALGRQFTPSPSAKRQLLDLIAQLFTLGKHRRHLRRVGVTCDQLRASSPQLPDHIDQRNTVQPAR